MNGYLSLWRLLPRVSVGLAFYIVVVVAVGGLQGASLAAQAARQFYTGFQSEFVAIVVSVFLLGTISTLGSHFSRILSSAFSAIAGKVIGLLTRNHSASNSVLVDLVAPISDIVESTYRVNREFFMRHYALKSAGDEKLEQVEAITAHFDKVRQHVDAIRDWDIICAQAYQESLSQDQRKFENMEEELAVDASLHAVLIVALPVTLIRMWELGYSLAIGTGVSIALTGNCRSARLCKPKEASRSISARLIP